MHTDIRTQFEKTRKKLKSNTDTLKAELSPRVLDMIAKLRRKRELLLSTKSDIISQTKRLLALHENTVQEKYRRLVEDLGIHSLSLKKRLGKLQAVLDAVNRAASAKSLPEAAGASLLASPRPRMDFWAVQDLLTATRARVAQLRVEGPSGAGLSGDAIKAHLGELANYYREHQLDQQKKVFRKRILQFFDNSIHEYCRLINSREFEDTLQLKSGLTRVLSFPEPAHALRGAQAAHGRKHFGVQLLREAPLAELDELDLPGQLPPAPQKAL